MGVKCFLVTSTDRYRLQLRRYVSRNDIPCGDKRSYHNASGPVIAVIDSTPFKTADGYTDLDAIERAHTPPKEDPRWPSKCDKCAYLFAPEDTCQLYSERIYIDESGREHSLRDNTPGMMWDADWVGEDCKGEDGKCLIVVCPNGAQWMIDGPASNCTMKGEQGAYASTHRCWCRHGVPPLISVDKDGRTCAAGAGSIQAGDYHGFLGIQGAPPGHFT